MGHVTDLESEGGSFTNEDKPQLEPLGSAQGFDYEAGRPGRAVSEKP